jgi:hypothetical protein
MKQNAASMFCQKAKLFLLAAFSAQGRAVI